MAPQRQTPRYLVALYVVGMLLAGSLNTLTTKIQLSMDSTGITGETETFRKPWFATFGMLVAMTLVLVVEQIFKGCEICRTGKRGELPMMVDQSDALLGNGSASSNLSWRRKVVLCAAPAAFDLLATALSCMGILYIPASVWQILRGAAIIFAALFSVIFLQRRLLAFNYLGLFCCVSGVVLVGLASVWGAPTDSADSEGDGNASDIIFGVTLVLTGQVVEAAHVIFEEWLLKDVDLPILQVVGFEGMWGVLIMLFIVYPALYLIPGDDHGSVESVADTFAMLTNSPQLMSMVALYLISCGTFNATGIAVTGALSAVHRMILEGSRTAIIWAFGLYVHYSWDANSKFGEQWTSWSWMQMAGFVVMVLGQAIYGEVLKIPGFRYPPPEDSDVDQFSSPSAARNFVSPACFGGSA